MTPKERLFDVLMDDYEEAVDPGNVQLQMRVFPMCAWIDPDTGFVEIHAWEAYVSIV